jgi:hypothetical protein
MTQTVGMRLVQLFLEQQEVIYLFIQQINLMAETTEIFILRLFIYGVVGALVVALSTLAVEKLGGTWGGFVR